MHARMTGLARRDLQFMAGVDQKNRRIVVGNAARHNSVGETTWLPWPNVRVNARWVANHGHNPAGPFTVHSRPLCETNGVGDLPPPMSLGAFDERVRS